MERLPRGRHGLSAEFVADNQRQRLIAGVTVVLDEVGYQNTTVSAIGKRAAVSKSDFYRHFDSKDECFLAAYEDALGRIRSRVLTACDGHPEDAWSPRVRDSISALIALLAADPPLARMALAEGLRAGQRVCERYQGAVLRFVEDLRRGAPPCPGGGSRPASTDEAVVGGIASLLGRQVLVAGAESLAPLRPAVVEFALTPYLGSAEARRIISAG